MAFTNYLLRLASDLKAGNATEHTHRPALQTLLESSIPGIKDTNEPRRIACGAPDYVTARGEVPIGYIEAKRSRAGFARKTVFPLFSGAKMSRLFFSILLTLACITPAHAVNKCTGNDGQITFQDTPCAGKGEALNLRPASGKVPSVAMPAPGGSAAAAQPGKPQTEAQRIEAQITASQQNRRKLELEARLVPEAFNAISQQRSACDQELKTLQARKASASNNLAGATYEVSISSEMTAIATRCGTRNSERREDHETLRKECQALGGCK